MILFTGLISGDEFFTDANKVVKEGPFLKVKARQITRTQGAECVNTGANPSQEEQQENYDEAVESGLDVVMNSKLEEYHPENFKAFLVEYKAYVKKLKSLKTDTWSPEKMEEFQKNASEAIAFIKSHFKGCRFFRGQSINMEEYLIPCWYEPLEDGQETPWFLFLEDGLVEQKC